MQIVYTGPNMHGVTVVGERADYWCPKDEPSDDMPAELAELHLEQHPDRFSPVPDPDDAGDGDDPTPDPEADR